MEPESRGGEPVKIDNEAVDRLNQIEIAQRLYKILPEDLAHQTLSIIMDGDEKWHQFLKTALSDPVACSVLFIVYMPPEKYETRSKLYQYLPPVWTYRYLCLLAKHHRKSGWESQFKALARTFLFVLSVDLQKLQGKPGTIRGLRENFEQASIYEDGTVRVETDLWPRARITWLSKSDRVEIHVHQLKEDLSKEEEKYAFSNAVDWSIIGWMQSFRHHPEIRDAAYSFGRGKKKVFCYVYKSDGKLVKQGKEDFFRLPLRDKYTGLRKKMESQFSVEEAEQEIDIAFFKSIFGYTEEKGNPPGYFRWFVFSWLSDAYQKLKEFYIDPSGESRKSLEEGIGDGIAMKEIIRSEPQSDYALVEETLRDIINKFGDKKDRIIIENYGKSDSQIAEIIAKRTGKPITKQAVQKKRQKIESILGETKKIEIRGVIREEENQTDPRTRKR
jgi:hypothetical protein